MVVPLVLKFGADPNAADSKGFAPLHYAASAGNYAVVEFLANNGADVDAENELIESASVTPLVMAYQKGRTRIANFLKLRGADEVNDALRKELEFAGAMSQAAEGLRELPEGVDPKDSLRFRFESLGATALKHWQATGDLESIREWYAMKDRLLQALEAVPRDSGKPMDEILRGVMGKALAPVQESGDPDERK